jgi:hypothetical protein
MNDCILHKRVSLNRSPASSHAIYAMEKRLAALVPHFR